MSAIRNIERLDGASAVYEVTDANAPAFDCVNAVKSHHAQETDADYNDLVARKVAENGLKGHFVVVVVEL